MEMEWNMRKEATHTHRGDVLVNLRVTESRLCVKSRPAKTVIWTNAVCNWASTQEARHGQCCHTVRSDAYDTHTHAHTHTHMHTHTHTHTHKLHQKV